MRNGRLDLEEELEGEYEGEAKYELERLLRRVDRAVDGHALAAEHFVVTPRAQQICSQAREMAQRARQLPRVTPASARDTEERNIRTWLNRVFQNIESRQQGFSRDEADIVLGCLYAVESALGSSSSAGRRARREILRRYPSGVARLPRRRP